MTIIALSGKARTGKDTTADVLVARHKFTKISLAAPLKTLCSRVFHLDPKMFEDELKDERMQRICLDFHDIDEIRKIVETEWGYEISEEARNQMEEYHGAEYDTPRGILRHVGTKLLRECVSDNIWIELALAKIKEVGSKIVITDCRFPNERDTFAKMGAVLCLIKRNDNGQMQEHEFNLGSEDEYDVVFSNDGSLHSYQSSVDQWYSARASEFQFYKVWKYE